MIKNLELFLYIEYNSFIYKTNSERLDLPLHNIDFQDYWLDFISPETAKAISGYVSIIIKSCDLIFY